KRRHRAQSHHRHAAPLQKIPSRKLQPTHAFATFVSHDSLAARRLFSANSFFSVNSVFRFFFSSLRSSSLRTLCLCVQPFLFFSILLGDLRALPSVTSVFSFFLLFAFLLCELCASALNLFKSPPLKFRRAQHQSRHHSHVHSLHRIVQLRLHNLRILNLLL